MGRLKTALEYVDRDLLAEIDQACARGMSETTGREVLGMLMRGEARLYVHPCGSMSVHEVDGETEVIHLWGRWDAGFARWLRKRLPERFVYQGRRGWGRYLRMKGYG